MTNPENLSFMKSQHRAFDGEVYDIPLLSDGEINLSLDSIALVKATEILAAQIDVKKGGIDSLTDKVGELLTGQDQDKGFIIEGENGTGSIAIDPQLTQVLIPNDGNFPVSTDLFFNMLYQWSQYYA